jgi:uncharacterized membrane protein YesL
MQLREPFHLIWKALRVWWDGWLSLLLYGLVWLLCWATIVLGPPATFGFFFAVRAWMVEKETRWNLYYQTGKKYFLASWAWFLANLLILFIVFANNVFYDSLGGGMGRLLKAMAILIGFLWATVQFYALPYFVLLEKKNLFIAWKNGLFTILASPLFSLVICIALGAFLFLHLTIMPLFFGGPGLIVLLSSMAVEERIEKFGIRERDSQQEAA